jgi:hypothetical protein
MHGCAAARIEIEHEADSDRMAPKTLVDNGGWLCGTNLGAAAIATKSSKATIPGASRMDKRTIVLLILPSLYRDEKQNKTDSTKAEDRCY